MASEMQERVARAIEEAAKDCDDPAAYYNVVALAAMEAMREPTPVMVRAYIDADPRRRRFAATAKRDLRAAIAAEIEAAKNG